MKPFELNLQDLIRAFGSYARICFQHFGDRVKHWITLNEFGAQLMSSLAPTVTVKVLQLTRPWCSAAVALRQTLFFHLDDHEDLPIRRFHKPVCCFS